MILKDGFPEFAWAVGEEGSDPIVSSGGHRFRHDQFRQSGHYCHQLDDLRSIRSLGVDLVRYGMPWRLAEPEPGRFDWALWDRAFQACDEAGLEPIVDLLHFGLPDDLTGFASPDWVDRFRRYVGSFLERYPKPRLFTPVNEPGITALLSARLGLWNDQLASSEDHARALAHLVLANLEALSMIRSDREGWWIGAEGFDAPVPTRPDAAADVDRHRAIGWLVWDLHFGVEPLPEAGGYLEAVDRTVLARIEALSVRDRLVAGHDFYPTSIHAIGGPAPHWSVDELVGFGLDELRRWHDRYQVPFWISETSNLTLPIDDQVVWLEALTDGLRTLRAEGRPARGLCWFSRGDQFDWQTALADPTGAVTEVGLYDVHRNPRPVASAFARLVGSAP
jgi:beta-glucosidase